MLFNLVVAASSVQSARAQWQAGDCQQPFSDKFDEFTFTNAADAAARLKKFEEAVNESEKARGIIHVYGGKKSRINEIPEIVAEIRKALKLGEGHFNSKFIIGAYGYLGVQTVELFIKPLPCSQTPPYDPGIRIEEVEFVEAPADTILKKSPEEISDSLVKKTESGCPPAARAVRACNSSVKVYVIINRNGEVIFSKAVSGHPLLQQAAVTTAKNWKFHPAKIKDKTYNVTGYITVEFQQPNNTIH
ncbi:MAG: energy transducer TonB [Acidobacteriota bacterium]|nr:energy transducer TonB [Acidobacteriota bacterium]